MINCRSSGRDFTTQRRNSTAIVRILGVPGQDEANPALPMRQKALPGSSSTQHNNHGDGPSERAYSTCSPAWSPTYRRLGALSSAVHKSPDSMEEVTLIRRFSCGSPLRLPQKWNKTMVPIRIGHSPDGNLDIYACKTSAPVTCLAVPSNDSPHPNPASRSYPLPEAAARNPCASNQSAKAHEPILQRQRPAIDEHGAGSDGEQRLSTGSSSVKVLSCSTWKRRRPISGVILAVPWGCGHGIAAPSSF